MALDPIASSFFAETHDIFLQRTTMEAIKRKADYRLRMMLIPARHHGDGECLSATRLVCSANILPDVGRTQLKKLGKAKLVKRVMGSKGGFELNRNPTRMEIFTGSE